MKRLASALAVALALAVVSSADGSISRARSGPVAFTSMVNAWSFASLRRNRVYVAAGYRDMRKWRNLVTVAWDAIPLIDFRRERLIALFYRNVQGVRIDTLIVTGDTLELSITVQLAPLGPLCQAFCNDRLFTPPIVFHVVKVDADAIRDVRRVVVVNERDLADCREGPIPGVSGVCPAPPELGPNDTPLHP